MAPVSPVACIATTKSWEVPAMVAIRSPGGSAGCGERVRLANGVLEEGGVAEPPPAGHWRLRSRAEERGRDA